LILKLRESRLKESLVTKDLTRAHLLVYFLFILDICKNPSKIEITLHLQYNDIAILTLASPVTFGPTMSPVCLPSAGSTTTYEGKEAAVIGWGALKEGRLLVNIWNNQSLLKRLFKIIFVKSFKTNQADRNPVFFNK
jgi:hypothetical protein